MILKYALTRRIIEWRIGIWYLNRYMADYRDRCALRLLPIPAEYFALMGVAVLIATG